jgi:ATF/CREB family transcription factor
MELSLGKKPSVSEASSGASPAVRSNFDLEPNPFEQSFASKATSGSASPGNVPPAVPLTNGLQHTTIATPGGRRHLLPPVAQLTSPAGLLANNVPSPGTSWVNSLRSGPLSPAMLAGPQAINGIGTTPNGTLVATTSGGYSLRAAIPATDGVRTGLTPGGSGTMFPTPGPATAALLGLTGDPMIPTSGIMTAAGPVINVPEGLQANGHGANPQLVHQLPQQNQYLPPQVPPQGRVQPVFQQPVLKNDDANHDTRKDALANADNNMPNDSANSSRTKRTRATAKAKGTNKRAKGNKTKEAIKEENKQDEDMVLDDNEDDYDDEIEDTLDTKSGGKKAGRKSNKSAEDDKRKSFLERNRIAALKCRQRKKQWLANLQAKVDYYSVENDTLNKEVAALREQVANLRSLLMDATSKEAGQFQIPLGVQQGIPGTTGAGLPSSQALVSGVQTVHIAPADGREYATAAPQQLPILVPVLPNGAAGVPVSAGQLVDPSQANVVATTVEQAQKVFRPVWPAMAQ